MKKKLCFSYLHIIELIIVSNVVSVVLFNNRQSPFYDPSMLAKVFYVVETIAFFFCMIIFWNMKLCLNKLLFIAVFFVGQIIAYIYASRTSFLISFSIHRVLLWIMAVYIFYFCAGAFRWSEKEFHRIMNLLVILGMVACTYNIFVNWDRLLMIAHRPSLYITYRSMFRSFFSTKSVFAMLVFFSSCAALYFVSINRRKYYIFYLFFFINIILSGARSIIAVTFLALLGFEIRNKKFVYTIVALIVALSAIYFVVHAMGKNNFIDAFLFHDRSGSDISSGRFGAWQTFFEQTNNMRLMVGYGFGSSNLLPGIYSRHFNYGSFHSMYIDCVCQGGLVYLAIMLYLLIDSARSMWKSRVPRQIKVLFGIMMLGYSAIMLTDSLGTLFETQVWSFLSTILIISLPRGVDVQEGERRLTI